MPKIQLFLKAACVSAAATALLCGSDLPALSGAANFREVSSYETSDGHRMKPHAIYRSGELSGLTLADQAQMRLLHIRYEFDLRTDKEREEAPSRWGDEAPQVIAISVGEPRNSNPSQNISQVLGELHTASEAQEAMARVTARLAIEGAPEIGDVLRDLAKGDEPALIHCTAGKDRTGVTVAMLMTLLGMPRGQVYQEYVLSDQSVAEQMERMKARKRESVSSHLASLPPEVLHTLMGARQSYIEAAFKAINDQYGSFDAYTANALKLTPEDIQALRARLLE